MLTHDPADLPQGPGEGVPVNTEAGNDAEPRKANTRLGRMKKDLQRLVIDEEVPDDTTISYFRVRRLGEDNFRKVFEGIVSQCIDKGLVKGGRQIVDSTRIIADIAVTSLTGLLLLCRRNVLHEVEKQSRRLAERLGAGQLRDPQTVKFTSKEKGLEKELEEAKNLLDGVTVELGKGNLKVTGELATSLELREKAVADREDEGRDRLVNLVDAEPGVGRKRSGAGMAYATIWPSKGLCLTQTSWEGCAARVWIP